MRGLGGGVSRPTPRVRLRGLAGGSPGQHPGVSRPIPRGASPGPHLWGVQAQAQGVCVCTEAATVTYWNAFLFRINIVKFEYTLFNIVILFNIII